MPLDMHSKADVFFRPATRSNYSNNHAWGCNEETIVNAIKTLTTMTERTVFTYRRIGKTFLAGSVKV